MLGDGGGVMLGDAPDCGCSPSNKEFSSQLCTI